MFLALKEIKHEKLRYGLIIGMILLISYLVYFLSGLAFGLAQQNTQAIDSWQINSVVLNKDANVNLNQSMITTADAAKLKVTSKEAYVGQAPIVVNASDRKKDSAQFIGLETNQFIAKDLVLTSGHKITTANQVIADDQFKEDGYKLGDKVKLNSLKQQFEIVGFTHSAKMSVAPVVYGEMTTWRTLKNLPASFKAGALVSKTAKYTTNVDALQTYTVAAFINKLPGYSAQNTTFTFMIVFLMLIALIVIAVFLYILTIQKVQNYAVLRAQGVPAKVLVRTTLSQALILVLSGLVLGALLTWVTALAIPAAVPMSFNLPILAGVTVGIIITGLIGALIPVKVIANVDPMTVIGG
ncbi:ABC transporter permease [Lacticaseibacillus brantae]|uniref:Putative hemin transport system permease protein HrtB n=1 Tax=Lacticaseibacillus brantae DSM 23927 TaxID=1423727 RepID=A0A0R2AZ68_9LACO|nr:ABC transporter permease [Lacticaseibacillus brantae]KRM72154.1 peptide ABC transporter permease [Lacticaseibacillus brantae DSM 23927]